MWPILLSLEIQYNIYIFLYRGRETKKQITSKFETMEALSGLVTLLDNSHQDCVRLGSAPGTGVIVETNGNSGST